MKKITKQENERAIEIIIPETKNAEVALKAIEAIREAIALAKDAGITANLLNCVVTGAKGDGIVIGRNP